VGHRPRKGWLGRDGLGLVSGLVGVWAPDSHHLLPLVGVFTNKPPKVSAKIKYPVNKKHDVARLRHLLPVGENTNRGEYLRDLRQIDISVNGGSGTEMNKKSKIIHRRFIDHAFYETLLILR
jgi:hypothetical protein